jgi:hypothetical protein
MDRRQETTAVKAALVKAGIPVTHVKHGTGTDWGWLEIYLDVVGVQPNIWASLYRRTVDIAQEVMGQHSEYDGKINIHWHARP